MNWKVPFYDLKIGREEKDAVLAVLDSNWLTAGPRLSQFEQAFADNIGLPTEQVIATSSCTAALHLAMRTSGIGIGDEVLSPALTFVATANAIMYVGATPVFVDICSDDEWNIDPNDLQKKISPNTKAIVVVHYGGYPCRMDQISAIAAENNLILIEDACHGPLAEYRGQKLGTIGDMGCFSFFSNKNMTTAEGGMLVGKDLNSIQTARAMRSHGITSSTYTRFKGHVFGYDVEIPGYNYRLDEIRAALGIEQLKKLKENHRKRKHLVDFYRQAIRSGCKRVDIPFESWDGMNGYHIFPILLPIGIDNRKGVMQMMAENGVQTSVHYTPVHHFSAYRSDSDLLPRTDAIAPRILSLPFFPTMQKDQIEYTVDTLNKCLQSNI